MSFVETFPRVSVVLPSLEPDRKLLNTIDELLAAGCREIVVVNDGSSPDKQPIFDEAASREGVRVLVHPVNRGKGAALRTAFADLLEHSPDTLGVITADSDGQHLTKDIIACARDMTEREEHIVLGCRDFSLPDVPERSRKGNHITSRVFKVFFHMELSDTQTGLRAIPKKWLPDMLEIDGDRYEYENNMLLAMRDKKIPYREVRIETVYEDNNKASHFRTVRDSLRIYWHLFNRIIKYALSSVGCLVFETLLQTLLHDLWKSPFEGGTGFLSKYLDEMVGFLPARLLSSILNFYLNKKFVFGEKKKGTCSLLRYYVLWTVQLLVTALGTTALDLLLGGVHGVAYFFMTMLVKTVIFFASYTVQKKWVFAD